MEISPVVESVILSTAEIEILDLYNRPVRIRALIDNGSQANFITTSCVSRLVLHRQPTDVPILGIGSGSNSFSYSPTPKGRVRCFIRPIGHSEPTFALDCLILDSICVPMPNKRLNLSSWSHLSNLEFADSSPDLLNQIDILLGASIFPWILKSGKICGKIFEPVALETIFGWVLSGNAADTPSSPVSSFFISTNDSLNLQMEKFWEVESTPNTASLPEQDLRSEEYFQKTCVRDQSGRYVVSLPFKSEPNFSGSREIALRRFFCLERKLQKDPLINQQYQDFMQDYFDSGHMEVVQDLTLSNSSNVFYIPQHVVLKPTSMTTKLRVVFDASTPDALGVSLNDCLLVGPKLQKDIITLLFHFRLHRVVFTADIRKMYRQILVNPSQQDYQRIVWRSSPDQNVRDYRLRTVTYGVSSAPFLALRTLKQLVKDEGAQFPIAADVLDSDVYIDDIVTGADSEESAWTLQRQLIDLLARGGFQLSKWASNYPSLLRVVPQQDCQISLSFDHDSCVKILGLQWRPTEDFFSFEIVNSNRSCTKRHILSELARLFDPLGFLSPVVFVAKHLVQLLWSLNLDWDSPPPATIAERWYRFKSELPLLSDIRISRSLHFDNVVRWEVHGFCDASEAGYAAVVYLRLSLKDSSLISRLLIAKSKVAPLQKLSLPRLELCGAQLLAKLISFVLKVYLNKLKIDSIFAWTDSMIVLNWLRSPPYRWKTFVANRVSHIQQLVDPSCWRYVSSSDNPADCASRGVFAGELVDHPLWWNGPPWLTKIHDFPVDNFVLSLSDKDQLCSEQRKVVLTSLIVDDWLEKLLNRFSSLDKIERIVAYFLRFIYNTRKPDQKRLSTFCQEELFTALMFIVKRVQRLFFSKEIESIGLGALCNSPLRKLRPFLDDEGILRVGGRLSHSELPYRAKHPVLLPRNCRLTTLIIERTHVQYHHPGLKTLSYLLVQNFWILSVQRAIRSCLSKCIKCFRVKPISQEPLMGDLPTLRVSQIKPFSCVGVDYAGPFSIIMNKVRGAKVLKAYLCLFVCFATKAVHLEIASDLSSESFLAALRRFIARRGRCSHIFSDCGTNFQGANRELVKFMEEAARNEKLQWHFHPPAAPHMGGLWEAGVKSVKGHLVRLVGDQILTFEELYTVFVQIEAILNSRPLTPISSDPNDLTALSPGHFLTLEPLTSLPAPDLTHLQLNRLKRWQLIVRLQQDFWARWHQEYLHTLQQRMKWNKSSLSPSIGDLVLIRNEPLPPLRWPLARITALHPGADGVARVATVKTLQGTFKRPVVKLCPLPTQ